MTIGKTRNTLVILAKPRTCKVCESHPCLHFPKSACDMRSQRPITPAGIPLNLHISKGKRNAAALCKEGDMKSYKNKYLVVGADFAGFPLKEVVVNYLRG